MENPKLECVKHIYSRPTYSQALCALLEDYIAHVEDDIKVEQLLQQIRVGIEKRKKGLVA
jgi:hypothetical protein